MWWRLPQERVGAAGLLCEHPRHVHSTLSRWSVRLHAIDVELQLEVTGHTYLLQALVVWAPIGSLIV
jgi:hypothetical protein